LEINIKDLFSSAGKKLKSEFDYLKSTNPHYAERGAEAEEILKRFLNDHIPKRYAASSAIIIDNENRISRQVDVAVYDAINSPIYRKDERIMILPSDNVAAAIEVKSNLTKIELKDADEKISLLKSLKKTEVTNVDQPVTLGELTIITTMGVVFAFNSSSSLKTLSENMLEINKEIPSNRWIDLIVVLDVGIITYGMKQPLSSKIARYGGLTGNESVPVPYYVQLMASGSGEETINEFYLHLLSHLTFFRKRSSVDFKSLKGTKPLEGMIITNYISNTSGQLVQAENELKKLGSDINN